MKISLVFAWYDLWVGAYWDRRNRHLYLLPVPCIGIRIAFSCKECDEMVNRDAEGTVACSRCGRQHIFPQRYRR